LKYPGKVLADEAGGRLFVLDRHHHRVVLSSLRGHFLDVVGSGAVGTQDGGYAQAAFVHPQAIAVAGGPRYVADTETHLLRPIDLKSKSVHTLAGVGTQGKFGSTGGPLRSTELNSPWDVLHHDGYLYVAMAGPHQIWRHKLGSDTIDVFIGTGRED